MATVERTRQVAAPPETVWAVLADFAAISSWAPDVDHSCLLTDHGEGVGASRRIQSGRIVVIENVLAWEPARLLRYEIEGLPPVVRSVTNTWELQPTGDGTTVTLTTEVEAGPRPPQQLIARVIGRKLARTSDRMLAGLADRLTDSTKEPA